MLQLIRPQQKKIVKPSITPKSDSGDQRGDHNTR